MKGIVQGTQSFTRRMSINASTGISLKDCIGQVIPNVSAAAILKDVDRTTGEEKEVACIVDGEGVCYTSISTIVMEQMEDLIELLNDGEELSVKVFGGKTKSGRDYLNIQLI